MQPDRKLINSCLAAYLKMLRYRSAERDIVMFSAMIIGVAIGLEMAEVITQRECARLKVLIDNAEHYALIDARRASQ